MTRDDIIRMAREAGVLSGYESELFQRFAALVAAAEREACAKVCGSLDETDMISRYDYRRGVLDCVDAIRARGNT